MKKIVSIIIIDLLICCSFGVQGLILGKISDETTNPGYGDIIFDKTGFIKDTITTAYESLHQTHLQHKFFFSHSINYDGGPQEEWNVTFGGDKYDVFFVVKQTNDGGFIAVGGIDANGWDNGGDCLILKTDENGQIQWHKRFGGRRTDNGPAVIQTSEGGYLVAAITASYGSGSNDAWLIKIDSIGNEQWNKTCGGKTYDLAEKTIIQTSEGDYLFVGSTDSYGAGGLDGWLTKIDSHGNEIWNKTYGTENNDHLWEVHETQDNGYIMVGYSKGDSSDAWIVKTDHDGNMEWEKKYGPANQGLSITQTTDGGYIFLTEVKDTVFGGYLNPWMVKIDQNGNKEWDKLFITPKGENNFAVHHNIKSLGDDYYILTGVTNAVTPVYSVGDMWISKIDGNGNILWEKIIGGSGYDTTYTVAPTSDGGFIVSGMTKSFGSGKNFNAWLVKVSDYENQRPNKPSKPEGPTSGKSGKEYIFSTSTTEPDGEQLYYIWNWGDGNFSEWFDTNKATYIWSYDGNFEIRVKAKDIYGGESEWSDPLSMSIQKSKMKNTLSYRFLFWNSHLYTILQMVLKLSLNNNKE